MHVHGSGLNLETDLSTSTSSRQQVTGGGELGGRRNLPPSSALSRSGERRQARRDAVLRCNRTPGRLWDRQHGWLQNRWRKAALWPTGQSDVQDAPSSSAHSSPHSVLPVLPVLASAAEELTRRLPARPALGIWSAGLRRGGCGMRAAFQDGIFKRR